MSADTHELIQQSLQGDQRAFGLIVERYQGAVSAMAYSVTGNLAQSEDLAQEAFIIAWKKLGGLQKHESLVAWLCGIARNLARDWVRTQAARPTLSMEHLDETVQPLGEAYEVAQHQRDRADLVWTALAEIPENYREPLILFYRQGESIRDIAEALELTEDNVKQRLSRGRKLLRAEVARTVEDTLADTRPGKAFTLGVIAALPALYGAKTAAVEAGTYALQTRTGVLATSAKQVVLTGIAILLVTGGTYLAIRPHVTTPGPVSTETLPAATAPGNTSIPVSATAISTPAEPTHLAGTAIFPLASPQKIEIEPIEISNPSDYITLMGSVVDSAGYPVPGAEVSVAALGLPKPPSDANADLLYAHRTAYEKYLGNRSHYWYGHTGENGAFTIAGVRFSGSTLITARAPGYRAAMKHLALDDSNVSRENIVLRLEAGVTIRGVLLSFAGLPVNDGVLKLVGFVDESGKMSDSIGLTALTNDRGQFEMAIDGPGVASLSARSESCGQNSFANVFANPERELVLRYPPVASVFGRVTDSDGAAVSGVEVRLDGTLETRHPSAGGSSPSNRARGETFKATTDLNGGYQIARVDSGQQYTSGVYGTDGTILTQGPEIEALTPGRDYRLNFTVTTPAIVRGTVRGRSSGKPIPGIPLIAIQSENLRQTSGISGLTSYATALSGPDGTYEISITGTSRTYTLMPTNDLSPYNLAGADVPPNAVTVNVRPGDIVSCDLQADEPGTRAFLLLDGSGKPVADAHLHLSLDPHESGFGYSLDAKTGADGRVVVSSIPPDHLSVISFRRDGFYPAQSEPLAVTRDETPTEEVIVTYQLARILLVVLDPAGEPLANQTMEMEAVFDLDNVLTAVLRTDANGVVSVDTELPATRLAVTFYQDVNRDGTSTRVSTGPVDFELSPGQNDLGEIVLVWK